MNASTNENVVLGVDIGGTKVAVGLVDRSGKILIQSRTPMVANGTAEAGLQSVIAAIDSVLQSTDGRVQRIGICAPGPLDPKTGIVLNPPNVPCWRNFPLAERIAAKYRMPVKVDNDANAAALAETRWGAARGFRYVFYTTVGTGIGTGIVFDDAIYHGNTGSAGEGGHVTIDYRGPQCGCGKRGCIEVLAAGPAIGARARTKLAAVPSRYSTILDFAQGRIESVTSEFVGKAYASGDTLAGEILQDTVDLLTIWLGNIVDLFDPDVLVFGGGVSTMLQPFFDRMKAGLPNWCVNPRASEIPLLIAHYGSDAGIAGGAALCSETS
ncbi:MAG TPA: ROK family protein [Candidatus Acidoferrales bacterium]|nr:ROK family protein [Candidatus Acidoferrales bacterium]